MRTAKVEFLVTSHGAFSHAVCDSVVDELPSDHMKTLHKPRDAYLRVSTVLMQNACLFGLCRSLERMNVMLFFIFFTMACLCEIESSSLGDQG